MQFVFLLECIQIVFRNLVSEMNPYFSVFILLCLVQIGYIISVNWPLLNTKEIQLKFRPSVSIIIAAKNELENLQELIPVLMEQEYPDFELIIAINNSTDKSEEFLKGMKNTDDRIKFLTILNTPDTISPKKYSLEKAINLADNEILLFTDADCRPNSSKWIEKMVSQLEGDIVLGYSPYFEENSLLNDFIQYETFQTGILYLGLATIGKPTLGVGRNLLYRKSLFINNKGFENHLDSWSGDDDLFVNQVASKTNTRISISEDSFVYSIPKKEWLSWAKQKIRHLSVGNKYKSSSRAIIGLNWLSQIGVFLLGLIFWPYFILFLVIKSLLLLPLKNKLKTPLNIVQLFFLDFLYSIYLIVFGFITLFLPKNNQKW